MESEKKNWNSTTCLLMVESWQMIFEASYCEFEIHGNPRGKCDRDLCNTPSTESCLSKAQTLASSSNVSSSVVELAQVAMNLAQRYPVTLKKGQLEWLVDPFDSCFMNIHRKMCYIILQLCVEACTYVYGYVPLYRLDTRRCYMRMMYAGTNVCVYIYIYTCMFFYS